MGRTFAFSRSVCSGRFGVLFAAIVFGGLTCLLAGHALAGFIGVPKPYDLMVEQDCRGCHNQDSNIAKPVYNPDRHHFLAGKTLPPLSDAPNADPGDQYECLSCHSLEYLNDMVGYVFEDFRDCLDCHARDSAGTPPSPGGTGNLALNKNAQASRQRSGYEAWKAIDGDTGTRWWTDDRVDEWLTVDLSGTFAVNRVVINWHSYYAREYDVYLSTDNRNWTRVSQVYNGNGGIDDLTFTPRNAGFVRIYCRRAERDSGFSIYEVEVYQDSGGSGQPAPDRELTVHHRSVQSQAGNCTYCHVVPDFALDRPRQAACRQCHGEAMHGNGGPILDFGACASCHNDTMTTAPASAPSDSPATYADPSPFHAKPPRAVGYTVPVGGKGSFNIFWAEFTDNGRDQEDTFLEDIEPNGHDMDDEGGFRFSRPRIAFTYQRIENRGQYYDVPRFPDLQASMQADLAPVVSIQSPGSGNTVSGNVAISVNASDDSAVSKVEYWVDQGSKVAMSGPDGSASGTWSASWDSHYIPSGAQNFVAMDGSHTISIQATDNLGQIRIVTLPVTVQNSASSASSSQPVTLSSGNLALNKPLSASRQEGGYEASRAADGNTSSRWWTRDKEDEWLRVDLGATYRVSKLVINWHSYYAREYEIQVSKDRYSWTRVKEIKEGNGARDELTFYTRDARYVRVYCKKADRDSGFSIYEVEVYQ